MNADVWLNTSESPSKRWRVDWEDERLVDGVKVPGRARLVFDGTETRSLPGVERPQDAVVNDAGAVAVLDRASDARGRPTYRSVLFFYPIDHGTPVMYLFRANANRMYADSKSDVLVLELLDTAEEDEVKRARFTLSTGARIFANPWP